MLVTAGTGVNAWVNTLYIPHCRVFNHLQWDFHMHAFLVYKEPIGIFSFYDFENVEGAIETSFKNS